MPFLNPLSEEQKKFIIENAPIKTAHQLSKELNFSYYQVYRFIQANKIEVKRQRKAKAVAETESSNGYFDCSMQLF